MKVPTVRKRPRLSTSPGRTRAKEKDGSREKKSEMTAPSPVASSPGPSPPYQPLRRIAGKKNKKGMLVPSNPARGTRIKVDPKTERTESAYRSGQESIVFDIVRQ